MDDKYNLDRRDFLKSIGAAGIGAALTISGCKKEKAPDDARLDESGVPGKYPQVPKRVLGKTGIEVSCLSHGIMYNLLERQIVLTTAQKWGINFIDTARSYAGGNSELGIGKFIKNNPGIRKDLVIMTKESRSQSIADVEEALQLSLKRMNTSYIDIYCGAQALSDPAMLNNDLKKWAESAKKRKLIKSFGFSTHKNMAKCLMAASKLDWIDVIFTTYNFRLMQDREMQEAIEACHKAGQGLIAMKVQGMKVQTDGDEEIMDKFLKNDYTDGQAKIKAVLTDKRFSSVCVTMGSTALITTNAAAVVDSNELSRKEMKLLNKYACKTKSLYCTGCGDICETAVPEVPFISDIMRHMMYCNSYGEISLARKYFSEIPADIRKRLPGIDFSKAEAVCPQGMPIGNLIREAAGKLS